MTKPEQGEPVLFGTVEFFIAHHRAKIAGIVRARVPNGPKKLTDHELRLWVLNDEELYTWARREGMTE